MIIERRIALVLLLLSACNFARNNPYDPKATGVRQIPGRISGTVIIEGGSAAAVAVRVSDSSGALVDNGLVTDASGNFLSAALDPGVYSIAVVVPLGNLPANQNSISITPGQTLNVGTLTSFLAPANGAVRGRVQLQNTNASPQNVEVVLVPGAGSDAQAQLVLTDAAGNYAFTQIRDGDYQVRAAKSGFTPDMAAITVGPTPSRDTSGPPDLKLYPASAVITFSVTTADGVIIGAPYSNTPNVELVMLAFGGVNQMRFSEDPNLVENGSDVAWRDYVAQVPFTLSSGEGQKTVYAQFRVVDASSSEILRSDIYSASIVYDATPPVPLSLTLGSGGPFLTDAQASVQLSASDFLSGIAGYQLTLGGSFAGVPVVPIEATGSSVALGVITPFGADGDKTLQVQWVDRAGNVSDPQSASAYLDTTFPATTPPAIVIGDGSGTVNSIATTLTFNVTGDRLDELLYVSLANASGQSATAPKLPLDSPMDYTLAAGIDGLRTVCAIFSDAAGNATTETCTSATLDTTGKLSGHVTLEYTTVPPPLSGVNVSLYPTLNPGLTFNTTTDSSGYYELDRVPAGAGYVLSLSAVGYATSLQQPVLIVAGSMIDRGATELLLARGSLQGVATFADKSGNQQGGIVIADPTQPAFTTTTGPNGAWLLQGVPIGLYSVQASAAGYFSQSYSPITVIANQTQTVAPVSVALAPKAGTLAICKAADQACNTPVAFTASQTVTLGGDYTNAIKYYASESSATPADTSAFIAVPGTYPAKFPQFTMAAGDGGHTIYMWFTTDNITLSQVFSASVTLDTTPPSGLSVQINSGAIYTNDPGPNVTLTLTATDALSGLANITVTNDANSGGTVMGYKTSIYPWALPNSDGAHSVWVKFCDAVGNCNTPTALPCTGADCAKITLDRLAPQNVGIAINSGATYTSSPIVNINLTNTTGDAVGVRLGNQVNLAAASYQAIPAGSSTLSYVLPTGDGAKTIYAQFIDAAGNQTTAGLYSASINLDATVPILSAQIIGSINPALGASTSTTVSNSSTVTINMTSSDPGATPSGINAYQLSNNSDFSTGAFTAWASGAGTTCTSGTVCNATGFVLSAPTIDGNKTVYVRVRDNAGNITSTSASIVVDTAPPYFGSITVDAGAGYVNDQLTNNHSLQLNAQDSLTPITAMSIANVGGGGSAATGFIPFAAVKNNWALAAGSGTKTVTVSFADAAGNTSGFSTITIADTSNPSGVSFTVNPTLYSANNCNTTPQYVLSTGLQLNLAGTDDVGISQIQISENSGFAGANWLTWPQATLTDSYVASSGDGAKTIYLQVEDFVGNKVQASPVCVTLDTTAPTWGSPLSATAWAVKTTTAPLTYTATDNLATQANLKLMLGQADLTAGGSVPASINCASLAQNTYGATLSFSGPIDGHFYQFYGCIKDPAGNYSAPQQSPWPVVKYDLTPPPPPAPNQPSSLGSSVLLSWNGFNPDADTSYYEVDYAFDPDFITGYDLSHNTGFNSLTTSTGNCGTGNTPPTQLTIPNLLNGRNFFFRVLAIDCAGNKSAAPVDPSPAIVGATPGIGSRVMPNATNGLVNLYSYGPDLWAHYLWAADNTFNGEVVRHCNAGSTDCQILSNWDTALAPINNQPNTNPSAAAATMLADDSTLFVFNAVNNSGNTWDLTASYCGRETDCTLTPNWHQFIIRSTSIKNGNIMTAPTAMATDRYFALGYGTEATASSALFSISKCTRHATTVGQAPTCRTAAEWGNTATGGDTVNGSNNINNLTTAGLVIGSTVTGSGIPAGTIITSIGGTSATMSQNATLTAAGNPLNFALDSTLPFDPNYRITAPSVAIDGAIMWGFRSVAFSPPGGGSFVSAGWPGSFRCEGLCETVASGCNGQICNDLNFNVFFDRTSGVDALPPVFSYANGTTIVAYREINASNTSEQIFVRKCSGSTECFNDSNYGSQFPIIGQPPLKAQRLATPNLAISNLGVGLAKGLKIRIAYPDNYDHKLMIATCDLFGSALGCAGTGDWPTGVLASGTGADSPLTAATIGQNQYLSSQNSTGEAIIIPPIVAAPYGFFAGPVLGSIELNWTPAEDTSGTNVTYGQTQFSINDPYTGSVSVSPSGQQQATVSSFTSNGTSDPYQLWTVEPFQGQPNSQTTLPASFLQMSVASATQGNNGTDDYRYAAALANGSTTEGEIMVGLCQAGTECNWDWWAVNSNNAWDTVQISLDYPRSYVDATIIGGSKPRVYVGGRWSGTTHWVQTCDLNAGPCNKTSGLWSGTQMEEGSSTGLLNVINRSGNISSGVSTISTMSIVGLIVGDTVTNNMTYTGNTVSGSTSVSVLASTEGLAVGDTVTNSVVVSGNTTTGSNSVSGLASNTGLAVGETVSGAGVPAATTVTAVGSTTVTLSQNATATANVPLTFDCLQAGTTMTVLGATTATLSKTALATVGGAALTFSGLQAGTSVTVLAGSTATLNKPATATATAALFNYSGSGAPVVLDHGGNGATNAASTTTSLRATGDYVMSAAVRDNGQVVVDFCDGGPTYPRNGCSYAGAEPATPSCFSANNWQYTSLGTGGLYSGPPILAEWGESVAAMPHPTYGWMVAQGNPNQGSSSVKQELGIWSCPYSVWDPNGPVGGNCGIRQNDCTLPSNWTYVRIPAATSSTSPSISALDITASTRNYYPIVNAEDLTSAVYISYYDAGWRLARCRDTTNPVSNNTWACAATATGNDAKGWTTTAITPSVFTPLSSTVRVINGDVMVMFLESQRVALAICPQGANCEETAAWHVMTTFNGPISNFAFGSGLLAPDISNGLYLGYPLASNTSLNFLSGGAMHGP